MKGLLLAVLSIITVLPAYNFASNNKKCCQKEPLEDLRCDSCGYYFDRGGRRMFETSYDSYEKGSFNLRRGHLWKDQCKTHKCRRLHKSKGSRCSINQQCYAEMPKHEHYSAKEGLTRWPSAPGPENGKSGTSAYPYIATPIWLRDTTGSSGYATPTSWQGFQ